MCVLRGLERKREMVELPVIDLAPAPAPDAAGESNWARSHLRETCERLGCFRVVGHGVSAALRADMKATVRALFDLSPEDKRGNADVIAGSGYVAPSVANPLYEAFGLYYASSPNDVDAFCSRLRVSPHHREVIRMYASKLRELAVEMACKIAEGLGVSDRPFEEWPCQIRINKYSFTEQTVGSSGVQIHTDNSFLTILQEDECVGGLELMDNNGRFEEVNPALDSLLINLGDIGKVWSNGRLHNVTHRVQCKEATTRYSIALFLLGPKDGLVEPPPELVDSDHPRLYRPFTYEEYRKLRLSSGIRDSNALSLVAAGAAEHWHSTNQDIYI